MLTAELLTETYGIRIEVDHDPAPAAAAHPAGRAGTDPAVPHTHRTERNRDDVPVPRRPRRPDRRCWPCCSSACGTTEAPAAPDPVGRVRAAHAPPSGPVTVTDGRGKEVTLHGPATQVVGLEWGEVENAVSLGVMPVGVADVKGYSHWVTAEPLDAVASRTSAPAASRSVDAIVALQPDLVMVMDELPDTAAAQLEKFVPVAMVTGSDARTASTGCAGTWR